MRYPRQYDDEFLNTIKQLIDLAQQTGRSVQDIVAKGQLTPAQYASLIQTVNGLIAKGEITIADVDKNNFKIDQTMVTNEFLQQIAGTADINAVPADNSLTTRKYVKKSVTPETTDFFNISDNKFNSDKVVDGKSIDVEGNVVNDSNYWLSDYIEYPNSQILSVTYGTYRVSSYDKDFNFFSRFGITSSSLINNQVGSDAAYIRISGVRDKYSVMVNDGSTLKPFVPYERVLRKENVPAVDFKDIGNVSIHPSQEVHFRKSKNLYNRFNLQKDTTMGLDGKPVSEAGRYLTNFEEIDSNVDLIAGYEYSFRYVIYDENKEPISGRINKNQFQDTPIQVTNFPSAKYIRFSPVEVNKDRVMVNEGNALFPYEDYGYKLVSTPQIPISIDNSIIPEGSGGGGGGSTTPSIAGSTQIFESISGNYATNVLTDVYSTTETSELDYVELSTGSRLAEIIITYIDGEGVEKNYKIIDASNSSELPQTIENIITHGGVNVEFLNYDEGANNYKIAIKNLKFSNGFKVKIRNTHSSAINIAVQMAGRYYV